MSRVLFAFLVVVATQEACPNPLYCNGQDYIRCRHPGTQSFFRTTITVTSTSYPLTIKTFNVVPLPGNTSADTVVWLLNPATNTIVMIDDDGNSETPEPYDSKLVWLAPTPGTYMVLIADYTQWTECTASVSIQYDGYSPTMYAGKVIGGWRSPQKEFKAGDTAVVTRRTEPGYPSSGDYDDSQLFLSTRLPPYSCIWNCGSYRFNDDDDDMLISRIDLDVTFGGGGTCGHVC